MADQTPQTTPSTPADPAAGTSQAGQASTQQPQGTSGVPNDPAAFQADYTKKYQELGVEKQKLETERAAVELEKQRITQMYRPIHQQAAQPPTDPLIDQFGVEGAAAIRQGVVQPLYQQLFVSEYQREDAAGKAKYGEESWNKQNYTDPMTGETKNKIMDLRVKGVPMDQAWNAVNPISREVIEEEVRKKVYAEIEAKAQGKPASAPTSGAPSPGTGTASTTEEAFKLAKSQLGAS